MRAGVCKDLPLYGEFNGNPYCILHYPDSSKENNTKNNFWTVFKERFDTQQLDFRGVWFPSHFIYTAQNFTEEMNFSFAYFNGIVEFSWSYFESPVHFVGTTINKAFVFNQGKLKESDFSGAVFNSYVSFYANHFLESCNFSGALFKDTTEFCESQFYQSTHFDEAVFEESTNFFHADFLEKEHTSASFCWTQFKSTTTFSQAHFESTADFSNAKFYDALDFDGYYGEISHLSLQFATFEKPEKVLFFRLNLHPNWFIHVDCRKFVFTDVKWQNLDSISKSVKKEIVLLEKQSVLSLDISNSYLLLKIAYRQLAENAETNNHFEEASKFRQMAFECERLERKEKISNWFQEPINCSSLLGKISEKAKSFPYDFVHWLYRWTSGYGENRLWAFFILFLIVTISAILYATPLCEFPHGQNGVRSLELIESIAYSLRVMVLQRPEPFPINNFAKLILALESVFAPLQLALLALAIRRKFMR